MWSDNIECEVHLCMFYLRLDVDIVTYDWKTKLIQSQQQSTDISILLICLVSMTYLILSEENTGKKV